MERWGIQHERARRSASGARWILWTLLISELGVSLGGAALPFIGGSYEDLRFVSLIPAVASLAVIIGVVRLTCSLRVGAREVVERLGRILVGLAILNSLLRWTTVVLDFAHPTGDFRILFLGCFWFYVIEPAALFTFVGLFIGRFECGFFPNTTVLVGVLLSGIRVSFGFFDQLMQVLGMEGVDTGSLLTLLGESGANVLLGSFGLVTLWRLSRILRRIGQGSYHHCGYDLRGLVECRCPECGVAFALAETMVKKVSVKKVSG